MRIESSVSASSSSTPPTRHRTATAAWSTANRWMISKDRSDRMGPKGFIRGFQFIKVVFFSETSTSGSGSSEKNDRSSARKRPFVAALWPIETFY